MALIDDKALDKEMYELRDLLNPLALSMIKSHFLSISRQLEDLRKSRDLWREKYEKLKFDVDNG